MRSPHLDHDQQPLLHEDHNDADVRFTIDDEVGQHDSHPNDAESSDPNAAPKYPPLPPSYDETIRIDAQSSSRWNPASWFTLSRATREHIQACLPRPRSCYDNQDESIFTSGYRKVWKYMPTSRLAQASAFIFGLWVLIIFTGPALYQIPSGNVSNGLHQAWKYSDIPLARPNPIKGDGHIVQEATWDARGCVPLSNPISRVVCTETTSFWLNPNKSIDSFKSTDSIFLDVDPIRPGRPEPAGSVPGRIQLIHQDPKGPLKSEEKGQVKVEITARYDEAYKFLFERSLVAKTKRGSFDEGVELLTYVKAGKVDESPLVYDVKVLIPKGTNVPTLACDAGASDIEAIFGNEPASRVRSMRKRQSGPLAHAPSSDPGFYFGKLHARTQVGRITAGGITALAQVHLTTVNGGLQVDGRLFAPRVELHSSNGRIKISPGVSVEAGVEVSMQTQNGKILVEKDATIRGTLIRATTANGDILANTGMFHANHSLSFRTDNGRIESAIGVHRPDLTKLVGPGLEKTEIVSVDATAITGSINLEYKEHDAGVVLHSKALSEISRAEVIHHRGFQGTWELRGATHSKIRGPGTKEGSKKDGKPRKFVVDLDNFGWINRHAKGRIWWDDGSNKAALPDGARSLINSQLGMAVLYFN